MFYIRTADRLERTSTWLERIEGGLDHVRDVVVHDSLGICAELESLMADHVADYRDEWAETINDPERLRRFVSFVNAPDAPDPIGAVRPRARPGQARPAAAVHRPAPPKPWKEPPPDDDRPREDAMLQVQLRLARRTGSRSATLSLLTPGRGVAALLPDGRQAALFLDRAGTLYAIDNRDPFTGAAGPLPRPDRLAAGRPVRRLAAAQAALRPGERAVPGRRGGGGDGVRGTAWA